MDTVCLTKSEARRVILAHQGLWPPRKLKGKAGIMGYISKVGSIQYDPLSIVAYNHELVLQSRVDDFRPAMLHDLLYRDRVLFDTWDKCMSICPVSDWPNFARIRERYREHLSGSDKPATVAFEHVRQVVRDKGPITSSDLDLNEKVDWWWAPTKLSRAALESLYYMGELVLADRIGTRRVYDSAEKHIHPDILSSPDPYPMDGDHLAWYVKRRIGSVGMLWNKPSDAWLGISGLKATQREAAFRTLLEAGEITPIDVEGIGLYMRTQDWEMVKDVRTAKNPRAKASILAPLDNLLWDRKLIRELFGFEYVWEVYKPSRERKYGYYVLPVLYGDRFICRMEPVRDKKRRTLAIRNLWWEDGVTPDSSMRSAIRDAIGHLCRVLGVTLEGDNGLL